MTIGSRSIEIPCRYVNLADEDVASGVSTLGEYCGIPQAARRLIVGSIGGSVTLTRPGGTEAIVSAAQLTALGGVVDRQFIVVQSDDCTDLSIDW